MGNCPNCHKADLVQHNRKPELLVCPLCWHKYNKEAFQRGEIVRVKAVKTMRYGKKAEAESKWY